MSYIMDNALDAGRLADCARNDAAMRQSAPIHAIDLAIAAMQGGSERVEVRRIDPILMDEYESGLDDVPTARMERDNPERWEEEAGGDE